MITLKQMKKVRDFHFQAAGNRLTTYGNRLLTANNQLLAAGKRLLVKSVNYQVNYQNPKVLKT